MDPLSLSLSLSINVHRNSFQSIDPRSCRLTATMAFQKQQLHFVLVPLMAPGHFLPMIDMAKLLAQQGVAVSIVTSPLLSLRFSPVISRAVESGLSIRLLHLRFPSVEAGLPEACETLETITTLHMIENFFLAISMLQKPFEQLFEQLKPRPNCIIADKHIAWLADTAKKSQVPRIIFDGTSCFTLLISHHLFTSRVHESVASESELFLVPGLPHRIELNKAQLPGTFNPGSLNIKEFRDQIKASEKEAYGMVINSFEELEQRYIDGLRTLKGDKIWCIGPLSLCNKDNLDKAERGNKASIDKNECQKWLNAQEPGSVVYACLGSLSKVTAPQLMELGLGLEASKRPFVWVVRGANYEAKEEIEKWMEEDGFEERTKGRGLLIRDWAPQVLILSHPAIGAFLTHCGWNSTLEGVCAGVPMVTWPIFAEQFFNEKFILQVLGIGVGVGAQVVVHMCEEDKFGVLVKKEAIVKAVEEVMDGGDEGEERRKRAREIGEMARKAMEGGSSYLNMKLLVQEFMQQC